jgi:cytidyltransferase-like protein
VVIALVTGGFDPIHVGHIRLIKEAGKIGRVVVGLNSDQWLKNKKGMNFMPFEERKTIIEAIDGVILATGFNDTDGSAVDAIRVVQNLFPNDAIVFCNGGDRTDQNIPEYDYCIKNQVEMRFGVGGGKANSSSWLLSNWASNNQETRQWGSFKTVYTDGNRVKVKELTVKPGWNTSYQKHGKRSEFWVVTSGTATVETDRVFDLQEGECLKVEPNVWHGISNTKKVPLKLVEVQYGVCDESDITRKAKENV